MTNGPSVSTRKDTGIVSGLLRLICIESENEGATKQGAWSTKNKDVGFTIMQNQQLARAPPPSNLRTVQAQTCKFEEGKRWRRVSECGDLLDL